MLRTLTHPKVPVDSMGFRLRGLEMTRLETLVDAAFAFSITMLALSADRVPTSFAEMYDLLRGVPAFVFSLAMLLLFWHGHVVYSRRYGLDDGPTTVLSTMLVAVMLVYVYPLKFMATAFFAYYIPPLRTADFFTTGTTNDLAIMFVTMSGGFVLMNLVFVLLECHALRRSGALGLTPHERRVARCEITAQSIYLAVGLVSILLAVLFRGSLVVISAGFVYASLGVLVPLYWARLGPTDAECAAAKVPRLSSGAGESTGPA
jgi:hypothetical protein